MGRRSHPEPLMTLYFIFLRVPRSPTDRRDDPFWEFGSFGKTGCHSANVLHPRLTLLRDGDRLAFLQGGNGEIRIVGVTPPIKVAGSMERIEWDKSYRPLPYPNAPMLIDNSGATAFPHVYGEAGLNITNRSTFCGAAASRLRSRKRAVGSELSKEILRWFDALEGPKIEAYPEAIQAEDGAWYKNALREDWANPATRLQRYRGLGQSHSEPGPSAPPATDTPKRSRSRC